MKNFRRMIAAFAVAVLPLAAVTILSCSPSRVSHSLSDIETYIDERPDSALSALRAIDTTSLTTRPEKAKYSLLHAIALDKNYIDTADTRIVQPAVTYYEKHGTEEERFKSLMYQGVALFNGGQYNDAIVSFYKASELAPIIEDYNLLGILYSRIADTFTMTDDHGLASENIEKSLEYFRLCGRKDQENLERIRRASNMAHLRKWKETDDYYRELMEDPSLEIDVKNIVRIDYAMFLLSSPLQNDSLAFSLITEALRDGAGFKEKYELFAYSYLLGEFEGRNYSDSLLQAISNEDSLDKYYYLYWRHKEKKRRGDYYGAYNDFWRARNIVDSLNNRKTISAAISHVSFLENLNIDKKLRIQNQKRFIIIILLLFIVLLLLLCVFYLLSSRKKQKEAEEHERINMVIDSLKGQLDEMDKSFEKIKKEKDVTKGARAKFAFLRDLYEEVYIQTENDTDAEMILRDAISDRIGDLRSKPQAREKFRRLVDKEMDGLMARFQKDYPDLSEDEYSLASYYFAGFDNTAVAIITNTSSIENTRIKKHRLKTKILNSSVKNKEIYSTLL